MFYLNQFFILLKKFPIRFILIFNITFLMVFSFMNQKIIEKNITKFVEVEGISPHFHALISSKENYSRIVRKIKVLPGVSKVQILSGNTLQSQLQNIMNELDINISDGISKLDFTGIKIIFSREIKEQSQNLIRDYLVRLTGKSNISLGPTKGNDKLDIGKTNVILVKSYGWPLIVLSTVIMWFLSFGIIRKRVFEHSYMLEKFQRKSNVSMKLLAIILSVFTLVSISICLSISELNYTNIYLLMFILCIPLISNIKRNVWVR